VKAYTIHVPSRALACLSRKLNGWTIPSISGFLASSTTKNVARFHKQHRLDRNTIPSGKSLLEGILKTVRDEEIEVLAVNETVEKLLDVAGHLEITVEDLLLSLVAYNLWQAKKGSDQPLLQIEAPPAKHETPIDRFADALHRDAIAERAAAREAAKLEPLTIVISDQQELKRIYALIPGNQGKDPIPMIRRHLRCWSRDELRKARAETAA
jgi:hypothetical protein